jgi:uncharacterized protein (TIGR00255 family)
MIRSMTAYSRASKDSSFGRWVVEIHSVNRKFLDINLSLPKELLFLDIEIRKWVAEVLQRGQITVRVFLQQEGGGAASLSTLKKLKESWEKTAKDLGFDAKEITLSFLLEQMPSFSSDATKDQEILRSSLKEVILQALKELLQMKEKEAVPLVQDMLKRVSIIEECKEKVVKDSAGVVDHYRKKLQDRLSEVLGPTVEGEERILREVVLFAEKIDLTEEITRLNSHIEQFRSVLSSKEKSVGRTLDFLVQEMNREINTLSAKCVGVELSLLMVTMKSELEKIREQLQNIE